MPVRRSPKETVLVLDEELERRVVVAARVAGVDAIEFIVRAIQRDVAHTLGERSAGARQVANAQLSSRPTEGQSGVDDAASGPWAIRPTPARVLRLVAEVSGLPIETIVGHQRSPAVARARAVSAYLLRHDVGLSTLEITRILNRKTNTLNVLVASVEQALGRKDPRARLLERVRRRFKNGLSSGKHYPPLPLSSSAAKFLSGLLACRLAAGITQREIGERAGVARETLIRLEGLRRSAQPETIEALARALGVPVQSLTTATVELPAILWPVGDRESVSPAHVPP